LQWITTCHPASPNRRAIAAPIRRAPPVTRTAFEVAEAWAMAALEHIVGAGGSACPAGLPIGRRRLNGRGA
jgi:hypothetical protein